MRKTQKPYTQFKSWDEKTYTTFQNLYYPVNNYLGSYQHQNNITVKGSKIKDLVYYSVKPRKLFKRRSKDEQPMIAS